MKSTAPSKNSVWLATLHLLGATLANCGPSAVPPPPAADPDEPLACTRITDALRTCTPASCTEPHPFTIGASVSFEVAGQQDGACVYNETIAAGTTLMRCRFSEPERHAYAEFLERYWEGDYITVPDPTFDCEYTDLPGQ